MGCGVHYETEENRMRHKIMALYKVWSKVQQNRLEEYHQTLQEAKKDGTKTQSVPVEAIRVVIESRVKFLDYPEWKAEDELKKMSLIQLKKLHKTITDKAVDNYGYISIAEATKSMRYHLKVKGKKPTIYGVDPNYSKNFSGGRHN